MVLSSDKRTYTVTRSALLALLHETEFNEIKEAITGCEDLDDKQLRQLDAAVLQAARRLTDHRWHEPTLLAKLQKEKETAKREKEHASALVSEIASLRSLVRSWAAFVCTMVGGRVTEEADEQRDTITAFLREIQENTRKDRCRAAVASSTHLRPKSK